MLVKIFFCYAREDKSLLNQLKRHLTPLQRGGLIDFWYDRDIYAGTEWEKEINKHLDAAQIVMLLVSPYFMSSNYCYSVEMKRALDRHAKGEAKVIPIILRPVFWQLDPLDKLQALPKDGRPVTDSYWHNMDNALYNVTFEIHKVVMQLTSHYTSVSSIPAETKQQEATEPYVITPNIQQVNEDSSIVSPLAVEKLVLLHTLRGHAESVWSVTISANGRTLVSGSADKTIKVWDLSTGEEVRTLRSHTESVGSIAISANGQTLVSGSADNTIKVWDLSTGEEVRTLRGHTDAVNSVAISTNGQILVSGSWDKTIKVWDLSTGEEVRTLRGHTESVGSIAISANGQTLVSGSADRTIRVWDLSTGEEMATLRGHTESVWSVAISTNGQILVSGSWDKTIKVWDLSKGEEVATLAGHTEFVGSVAISADGQALVSGGGEKDNTINHWC